MNVNELEARLEQLRQDKSEREEQLATIPTRLDELRASLRRAKGEAHLGNANAEDRRERLEGQIAKLIDQQESLTAALEILDEEIPVTRSKIADMRKATARDGKVVEHCLALEAEAWARVASALEAAAAPLQEATAAAHVARKHGGDQHGGTRCEAARKAIATILTGTESAFAEMVMATKVRQCAEAILQTLSASKIETRAIELPEIPAPAVPFKSGITVIGPVDPEAAADGVINMGRNARSHAGDGRSIEQSARPLAGYRGEERPIAGFACGKPSQSSGPTEVEQVSVFPGRRA